MPFNPPEKVSEVDVGHLNLLHDTQKLKKEAEDYEFHDFKNGNYATPKNKLREYLLKMAEEVINGRYDN